MLYLNIILQTFPTFLFFIPSVNCRSVTAEGKYNIFGVFNSRWHPIYHSRPFFPPPHLTTTLLIPPAIDSNFVNWTIYSMCWTSSMVQFSSNKIRPLTDYLSLLVRKYKIIQPNCKIIRSKREKIMIYFRLNRVQGLHWKIQKI